MSSGTRWELLAIVCVTAVLAGPAAERLEGG